MGCVVERVQDATETGCWRGLANISGILEGAIGPMSGLTGKVRGREKFHGF